MEYWDVLDVKGKKTGRIVQRGKKLGKNEFHLVVHVWIKNNLGKYLISKRTPNKTYPNMWETTGGAAISGDNSLKTALKEVKEELGIDLEPTKGQCLFRIKKENGETPNFLDVWLFEEDIDISQIVFQQDETCDAKWVTKNEILEMIEKGDFVDTYSYLDKIFL